MIDRAKFKLLILKKHKCRRSSITISIIKYNIETNEELWTLWSELIECTYFEIIALLLKGTKI